MAQRPTVTDLVAFMRLPELTVDDDPTQFAEALNPALEWVEDRVNLPDGADADGYPQSVRSAVLYMAKELYQRVTSQGGVLGFGEFGAVRMADFGNEVLPLLERFLKLDGFA